MAGKAETPIIKKVKKVAGHGHHGGAWKVAYADFVTAMMAFFLLMWLLNATEAEKLAGLADYFAPTVGIKGQMGIGFRGGKSVLSKGVGADKNTNKGIVYGGVPTGPIVKVMEKFDNETTEPDAEKIALMIGSKAQDDSEEVPSYRMGEIETALSRYVSEVAKENEMSNSIDIVQNSEGLQIQIKDTNGESMFEPGTANFTPKVAKALEKLSEILGRLPNYISITGHTSSNKIEGKVNYTNWELSADRANATRRLLVSSGIQNEQIAMVIGKSDNDPLDDKKPDAPENNRISIVLLRQSLLASHKKSAPEGVFLSTDSKRAKELIDEEKAHEDMLIKKEDARKSKEKSEQDQKNALEIKEAVEKAFEDAPKPATPEPAKTEENPATPNPDLNSILRDSGPQVIKQDKNAEKKVFTIEENKLEKIPPPSNAETSDPFKGGDNAAPDKLFVDEPTGKKKKVDKVEGVNADLFKEEKKHNEEEFNNLPTTAPLIPGLSQ